MKADDKNIIRHYRMDDWEAVYLNEWLHVQNHDVESLPDLMAANQPFTYDYIECYDLNLKEWGDRFPQDEREVMAAIDEANNWPKVIKMYLHEDYQADEMQEEYFDPSGLSQTYANEHGLYRMHYEVELTYAFNQDGTYTLTHFNGEPVTFGEV